MASVFEYTDYRSFLDDHLRDIGQPRRFLAEAFGKSEAWVSRVMRGGTSLKFEHLPPLAGTFGLGEDSLHYLTALCELESRDRRVRADAWGHVQARYRAPSSSGEAPLAEGTPWFVSAVHVLAQRADFVANPTWIAPRLIPAISEREAFGALVALRAEGLLGSPAGPRVVADHSVERAFDVVDVLRRQLEDVGTYFGSNRSYVSAMSMCQSEGTLRAIHLVAREAVQSVLHLAEAAPDGPSVALLVSAQWLPVTRVVHAFASEVLDSSTYVPERLDLENPYGVTLPEFVRRRMDELGLAQRDLAAAANRSEAWASRLLSHTSDIHHTLEREPDEPLLDRLCDFLKLDPMGRELLRALVDVTSPSPRLRGRAWIYLAGRRQEEMVRTYMPLTWHDVAILELTSMPGFRPDPVHLATLFQPPLSPSLVSTSLRRLYEGGYLDVIGDHVLRSSGPVVGNEDEREAVRRTHLGWCAFKEAALGEPEVEAAAHLECYCLLVPVGALPEIQALLNRAAQTAFGVANGDEEPASRVYHLGLQALVVSGPAPAHVEAPVDAPSRAR